MTNTASSAFHIHDSLIARRHLLRARASPGRQNADTPVSQLHLARQILIYAQGCERKQCQPVDRVTFVDILRISSILTHSSSRGRKETAPSCWHWHWFLPQTLNLQSLLSRAGAACLECLLLLSFVQRRGSKASKVGRLVCQCISGSIEDCSKRPSFGASNFQYHVNCGMS